MRSKSANNLYADYGSSLLQRVTMSLAIAACVALAWWLLLGGGIESVSARFGGSWPLGNSTRRLTLAIMLSIYFLRLLLTQFVFLRRSLGWSEVCMIVPWVLFIYLLLAFKGGTNPAPFNPLTAIGVLLFLLGSWLNSYAEYARHLWKQKPENHGRLYTLGLFRYSRHPNYLGDLISFSGLCLTSGRWITLIIPAILLAGFIFANIPMLDTHLHDHYGAAFDDYAAHTSKLIPFLY